MGRLGYTDTPGIRTLNDDGQFQPLPHRIEDLEGIPIAQVACGDMHSLAAGVGGQLYVWGSSELGRLGIPAHTLEKMKNQDGAVSKPILLESALDGHFVTKIAGTSDHAFAITAEGALFGWGGSSWGSLGLGDVELSVTDYEEKYQPTPLRLETLKDVKIKEVACDDCHGLALSSTGEIYAWGQASYGRLGLPPGLVALSSTKDEYGDEYLGTPQKIPAMEGVNVISIAAGRAHNMAISDRGNPNPNPNPNRHFITWPSQIEMSFSGCSP